MRKAWIAALALSVLAVGVLAGPAAAKPKDKHKPKAPKGNEHITITFDIATNAPGTVQATGPISGSGTDTQVSSKQHGRTTHDVDLLTFDAGTITVKDKSVVVSQSLDPSTCTSTEHDKGVFKITKGTGAYEGAKGHGHFTVDVTATGTPDANSPNGCDFSNPTGSAVVEATGRVRLKS